MLIVNAMISPVISPVVSGSTCVRRVIYFMHLLSTAFRLVSSKQLQKWKRCESSSGKKVKHYLQKSKSYLSDKQKNGTSPSSQLDILSTFLNLKVLGDCKQETGKQDRLCQIIVSKIKRNR